MVEDGPSVTTDAVIVATRGVAPMYERDGDSLRLRRFTRGQTSVADLAECPRLVDDRGDPLRALVVRSAPLAPGVRVQVRPLALLNDLSGSPVLVAAPVADEPACSDPERLRPQLERLAASEGGYAQTSWTWADRRAAASYVQDAAARSIRLRSGRRAVSSWAAVAEEGVGGSTAAEAQLTRLPARFQEFVREQLDEPERILLFVHRPQIRPRMPFARATREALLVATDQQVLWLEDVLPHEEGVPSYGYDARTVPVERISAVRRTSDPQGERLHLRSEAAPAELVLDLPPAAGRIAGDIEDLIRRFVDRPGSLPRRVYAPRPPLDPLVMPEGWPDLEPVARGLYDQVTLERGAPHIAVFIVPARPRSEPQGLLALYPDALVFVPVPGQHAKAETHRLADASWVELRRSLLLAHVRIVGRVDRTWTSASLRPIVALFRPLRQLLANAPRPSDTGTIGD